MAKTIDIQFNVFGEKQFHYVMGGLRKEVEDMRPAFKEVIKDFQKNEKEKFESGGAHGGLPAFAPLTPDYAAYKEKIVGKKPILTFTGALGESLQGGDGWVEELTPRNATFGSTIQYGKYHQTGYYVHSKQGMKWVPKRPPIELTAFQVKTWNNIFTAYIRAGIDRKKVVKYNLSK